MSAQEIRIDAAETVRGAEELINASSTLQKASAQNQLLQGHLGTSQGAAAAEMMRSAQDFAALLTAMHTGTTKIGSWLEGAAATFTSDDASLSSALSAVGARVESKA